MSSSKPQPLTSSIVIQAYTASHNHNLLLFDYDGTLTPIVPDPPSAILSPETRHSLALLANNPRNTVWVISGRARPFLTQHLSTISPRLGLCAEHGAFIREPGCDEWVSLGAIDGEDMGWRGTVCGVFEDLMRDVEGSKVEAKEATVVWHFRRALDARYAECRARAVVQQLREGVVGRKWKVEVVEGKCVVEVRARNLGKGNVVKRLVESEGRREWGFVGCWGDDRTDEDMFQALSESDLADGVVFSVKVGDCSSPTWAKWIVADPEEVLNCIKWLTDVENAAQCDN